jgi:hypothetical protein
MSNQLQNQDHKDNHQQHTDNQTNGPASGIHFLPLVDVAAEPTVELAPGALLERGSVFGAGFGDSGCFSGSDFFLLSDDVEPTFPGDVSTPSKAFVPLAPQPSTVVLAMS